MKHFLVGMAALALIALPANAEDISKTGHTFAARPGSVRANPGHVPELKLPAPGSTAGATCDTCPGEAGCVIVDGIPEVGDTTGNTASGEGETLPCLDNSGVIDAFYSYDPSCTGIATLSAVTAGGSPMVMVHGSICNALVACDDTGAGLTFPVNVGEHYNLRVGDTTGVGTYTLSVDCAPSVCDNGAVEPGEDCDPSAPPPNDTCPDGGACPSDTCDCSVCPASELTNECNGTLSQSSIKDPTVDPESVSCGAGAAGNNWARCFDDATEGWGVNNMTINSVTFEVGLATDGAEACVNLYEIDSCDNIAGHPVTNLLLPICTECITVNASDEDTLVTVNFPSAPAVAAGFDLIIEVNTNIGVFIAEGNAGTECGPTYIRASACGLNDWTPFADIGFPNSHLVLNADVSCADAGYCGNDIADGCEACDGPDVAGCDPGESCDGCRCTAGPPANDNCADRIQIFGGSTDYTTVDSTTDGLTHIDCEYDGVTVHDVWYNYESTCDGVLRVTTCEQLGGASDYDTDIVVYACASANCDLLACPPEDSDVVACDDDDSDNPCGQAAPWQSTVEFPVALGDWFKIRIGGFAIENVDFGTGTVRITCLTGCSNGLCDGDENPCTCEEDCGVQTADEVGLCTDGVDNDCDGTTDCADDECADDEACQAAIPTVSEWGMIALTLLLVVVGGGMIVRRRRLA